MNRIFLVSLLIISSIGLFYYGGRSYIRSKSSAPIEIVSLHRAVAVKSEKEVNRLESKTLVTHPPPRTEKQQHSPVALNQKIASEAPPATVSTLLHDLKTTQDEAESGRITLELLNLLESEQVQGRQEAFNLLLTMKDHVRGENLQEVFKRMHQFGEEGGNEALVDSFVNRKDLEGQNRVRLLSYVDPAFPLGTEAVEQLTEAYQANQEEGARQGIVQALARAGNEEGVAWIINRAQRSTEFSEWEMMINSLAFSQSPTAFDYLHTTLNTLVPEAPMYKEHMEILRQAIRNTEQQQEDRQ